MLISREKRATNIIEYILYMWQVEDTIRAFEFDMDRLNEVLVGQYEQSDEIKKEIREWYENISTHMKREKVERAGHVQFLKNVIRDIYNYHLYLLQQPGESQYSEMYALVLPLISEMNSRQNRTSENEIETCLNAVYIYMMMRLKKNAVSAGTEHAINLFIRFLSLLAYRFRAHEEGK